MRYINVVFSTGNEFFGEAADPSGPTPIQKRLVASGSTDRRINRDGSFENSVAEYTLENSDGYFDGDKFLKDEVVKEYDDLTKIFTGRFSNFVQSKVNYCRFRVDTRRLGFQDPVNKKIKIEDFSSCPTANIGQWGNVLGGVVSDEAGEGTGMVVARRVDTNKYLLAWHHCFDLTTCYNSEESDITGSCSLDNNADGNAYINYTSADLEIYVNCYGIELGSTYAENPAEILDEINAAFGSFTLDGVTDAAAVYAARSYTGAYIVIDDGITWETFLTYFARNFDCRLYQKANGNLGIKAINWLTETAESTIEAINVENISLERQFDVSNIVNEYTRNWYWHFRTRTFQLKASDVTAETVYSADIGSLDLEYHSDDLTSKDVAARKLFFDKTKKTWWLFKLPRDVAKTIELASVHNLKSKRWTGTKLIQIYAKSYVSGSNKVDFEALDITAIRGYILYWRAAAAADVLYWRLASDPTCYVFF